MKGFVLRHLVQTRRDSKRDVRATNDRRLRRLESWLQIASDPMRSTATRLQAFDRCIESSLRMHHIEDFLEALSQEAVCLQGLGKEFAERSARLHYGLANRIADTDPVQAFAQLAKVAPVYCDAQLQMFSQLATLHERGMSAADLSEQTQLLANAVAASDQPIEELLEDVVRSLVSTRMRPGLTADGFVIGVAPSTSDLRQRLFLVDTARQIAAAISKPADKALFDAFVDIAEQDTPFDREATAHNLLSVSLSPTAIRLRRAGREVVTQSHIARLLRVAELPHLAEAYLGNRLSQSTSVYGEVSARVSVQTRKPRSGHLVTVQQIAREFEQWNVQGALDLLHGRSTNAELPTGLAFGATVGAVADTSSIAQFVIASRIIPLWQFTRIDSKAIDELNFSERHQLSLFLREGATADGLSMPEALDLRLGAAFVDVASGVPVSKAYARLSQVVPQLQPFKEDRFHIIKALSDGVKSIDSLGPDNSRLHNLGTHFLKRCGSRLGSELLVNVANSRAQEIGLRPVQ